LYRKQQIQTMDSNPEKPTQQPQNANKAEKKGKEKKPKEEKPVEQKTEQKKTNKNKDEEDEIDPTKYKENRVNQLTI